MISFVLISCAAGLLLAAQLTGTVQFTIAAMAVSLISIVPVIARVRADRSREFQQSAAAVQADDAGAAETENCEPAAQPVVETGGADDQSIDVAEYKDVAPPTVVPDSGGELVHVIPGRKRFHEPGCGALSGRQSEELTRDEAEEEGFTACSLCSAKSTRIRRVV